MTDRDAFLKLRSRIELRWTINGRAAQTENRKVGGSTPPLATTLACVNASFDRSSATRGLIFGLICPTGCPQQLVDLAGDVVAQVWGEVLVAGGHGVVGPPHQAHDRALVDAQHQQHGGGSVPGIVQPRLPHIRFLLTDRSYRLPAMITLTYPGDWIIVAPTAETVAAAAGRPSGSAGSHDRFADLVRRCGLEYRGLPGDPLELVRARTAAPFRRPRDRSSPRSSTSWARV